MHVIPGGFEESRGKHEANFWDVSTSLDMTGLSTEM